MNKNKIIGSIYLTLAACIWGGMFVVVKSVVSEVPPIQLVWLRYLIGSIALLVIALVAKIQWHWDKRNLLLIFLIGLIGDTISIVAQETGTMFSSAQLGSVVTTATPAFMIIFSWPLLKIKPTKGKWISLSLAILGVVSIVGFHFKGKNLLLGVIFLLIAGLTWALMSVLIELVDKKYSIIQVTFLGTLVAIVCLMPVIFIQKRTLLNISWGSVHIWLSLLYLGIISTAIAFFLWNKGLVLFHSSTSGLFFLFQPIVGTLLGWLFLNESIKVGFFIGLGLILVSIIVSIRNE
ncbi:EamA family transporter [Companilactobacillus farciminis]|nr:EamA family transporter [Companilactobacillus farciminis]